MTAFKNSLYLHWEPSGRSEEAWGFGAVKRRFWEKGDGFERSDFWASAWITGGVVRGASTAKACGVNEENRSAANAAFDGISLEDCDELDFFPRIDRGSRILLEKNLVVVLGVGGERKI